MKYQIPELILQVGNSTNYNPALAVALNKLLRTRVQSEYEIALQEATQIAIGYENVNVVTRKDYGQSSVLAGMPLFMPLELKGVDGLEPLLLESAVVNPSRTKNIVETQIQGRDTSVDEWINNGDWIIQVNGILCSNEARYPIDLVQQFQKYMDLNTSIQINHEMLNAIGIFEIIIKDQKYDKTPHFNCQIYSFTCKATKPLPLIINENPDTEF